MRLKYTFETMELEDKVIAVPVGESAKEFRGVIRLNESAAEIFDLLKQETTEEAVVAVLKERYGDEPEILEFVHEFIENLTSKGVLA